MKTLYKENPNAVRVRKYAQNCRIPVDKRKLEIGACLDCNLKVCVDNLLLFDFDHRNEDLKLGNVARIRSNQDESKVIKEMKKCDLVCCACHQMRTIKQNITKRQMLREIFHQFIGGCPMQELMKQHKKTEAQITKMIAKQDHLFMIETTFQEYTTKNPDLLQFSTEVNLAISSFCKNHQQRRSMKLEYCTII